MFVFVLLRLVGSRQSGVEWRLENEIKQKYKKHKWCVVFP